MCAAAASTISSGAGCHAAPVERARSHISIELLLHPPPPPPNSLRILSRCKPPLQPCPQQPPLAPASAPPRHALASRCASMQHLAAERVSRGIPTFAPRCSQSVRVDEHAERAAPGTQPPRSNAVAAQ
jgi:hypothetical protein